MKLLLVLGIAFALRRPGGNGDSPSGRPGGGDGASGSPSTTSGHVNARDSASSGPNAVAAELQQGRGRQSGERPGGDQTGTDGGSGWSDAQRRQMTNLGNVPDGRRVHILDGEYDLDGDHAGGGHAPGVGVPGNSEFPDRWSDDQIIANTQEVARNPTSAPVPRANGGWEVQGEVDGVVIQVILNRDGTVWTSYPISGDGVVVNPR